MVGRAERRSLRSRKASLRSAQPQIPIAPPLAGPAHGWSPRRQRVTGYILTALPTGAASGPPSALAECTGMQVRSPGTAQGLARATAAVAGFLLKTSVPLTPLFLLSFT